MIRLNVFFEKKEEVKVEAINALCKELVEKSLKDNGNIATTISPVELVMG